MRGRTLRIACAIGLCIAVSAAAGGERLTLMAAGIEKQIYLPATLAQRLGYFRQEGLDVELLSEPSGVSAADVLLAGSAHGVIGAYDHTIDLQAKGKSVQSLVQFTISPGEVQLVAARLAGRIRSPADFRGFNLGVTGLGSSTSFLTQYLATLHDVKPTELTLVPVGGGQSFVDAFRSRAIDAGMTTEPTASRLVAGGEAMILVDLRTPEATQKALGGLYPFSCLYVQTAWLNTHHEQAQKLANALVRALAYIHAHTASEIASQLPESYMAGNRALYIQSLALSKPMFTPDGVMPPSGPPKVLSVLAAVSRTVRAKRIDLSKTYTTDFVNAAR